MTDTTPVLLGEGRLTWGRYERVGDRYGAVVPARGTRREYTRHLARIAAAGTALAAVFAAFAAYRAGWPIPHTVAATVLAVGAPSAGYAWLIAGRYHRGYVIANGRMRVAPKPEEH